MLADSMPGHAGNVTIPFVDAHHHLWDLHANKYDWLTGTPRKTHFGSYEKIRRDYLVPDLLRDARTQHLVKSVHIEACCDEADPLAEPRWVQAQADQYGFPHGIVAHADLTAPDVVRVLEALRKIPNVRGVRMLNRRIGELAEGAGGSTSPMQTSAWRRGFAVLGELGLSFDLQAPPPLMPDAVVVAADFPDVAIVLTHAGLPLDRSAEGIAQWRRGMRLLAQRPNVWVKISGLPQTDWHWSVDSLRPIVEETIDIFGTGRTMIGSNFPVDGLFSDYATLIDAYRQIIAGYTRDEQQALLHDNALRFYRL